MGLPRARKIAAAPLFFGTSRLIVEDRHFPRKTAFVSPRAQSMHGRGDLPFFRVVVCHGFRARTLPQARSRRRAIRCRRRALASRRSTSIPRLPILSSTESADHLRQTVFHKRLPFTDSSQF